MIFGATDYCCSGIAAQNTGASQVENEQRWI